MANLTLLNPIDQIYTQKIEPIWIDRENENYFETDLTLFEDQQIGIDSTIEIYLERGDIKKLKAHVWNVYDGSECEDVVLNELEKRQIENYLSSNLIIKV